MAGVRGLLAVIVVVMLAAACAESVGGEGLAETGADQAGTDSSANGSAETVVSDETTTTSSTIATTTTVAVTTTTITPSGVAFASRIEADGRAVDPGIEFSPDVNNLYAVFQPGRVPPGLEVNVEDPDDGAYYAYLRPTPESRLSTFGWRWFHQGQSVVEYEADVTGGFFWLERLDRSDAGIFGGDVSVTGMGPGEYLVEFTVSGNPLFSERFTISRS